MICRVVTELHSSFFQRSCVPSVPLILLLVLLPGSGSHYHLFKPMQNPSSWPLTFGSAYTQYYLSQALKSTLGPESIVIPFREKSKCPIPAFKASFELTWSLTILLNTPVMWLNTCTRQQYRVANHSPPHELYKALLILCLYNFPCLQCSCLISRVIFQGLKSSWIIKHIFKINFLDHLISYRYHRRKWNNQFISFSSEQSSYLHFSAREVTSLLCPSRSLGNSHHNSGRWHYLLIWFPRWLSTQSPSSKEDFRIW